jgi:hypothetical protein
MPIGVPIINPSANGIVNFLEVYKDDTLLLSHVLQKDYANVQSFPILSSGLVFTPDSKHLAWIAATDHTNIRKSKLGYSIQMFDPTDFGEDVSGVYKTVLVVFNIETRKANVLRAPPGHSACQFTFASSNIIVLQAVDISAPRRLGLHMAFNRPFH